MIPSKRGFRIRCVVFGLGLLTVSCSLSGSLPAEQTRPGSMPGDPEARARQIRRGQANMQVDREGGLRRPSPSQRDDWQAIDLSAPDFDALHYRVSLSFPDVEAQRFDGQVQLTFQPLRNDLQLLSLDSSGLEIRSVRLLNTYEELRFESQAERLLVDLGRVYSRTDTLTVLIEYGWAKDPNLGIYFRSRDGVRGIETFYSQSEAEESKYWFPGYGRPNDRAVFESFITLPEPYVAVSNGSLVGVESRAGRRTYHWSLSTPVVSYLFVVTAGKFAVHEERWRGIGVQYYGYPDDMERLTYSLRNTPAMLSALSDRIGLAYPYEKYSQTVVPQYQWGGMEHVTATTLTDRTVHGPDEEAEFSSEPLVSHELAHQWFGDLATCRSWDHIWLNEGFATFFEGYWTEHSRGRAAFLRELEDGAAWYFSEEDADPRPVVFPYYRVNLDDYFDSRAYAKGAWVLHMLRTLLGEELFFKGVRHYIHRRQGKLVVTADLRKDFEESTGRELGWFFEQWLEKPGYPKFAVTWTAVGSEVELVVRQTQDTSKPGGLAGKVPYFKGPVWIELGGIFRRVELSGREKQNFRVPVADTPAYVKFNSMSSMLAQVETVQSFDAWKTQLERSPDPVARVEAARMLARLPEISIDVEADQLARVGVLSSCARTEREGWVRSACVDSLAAIASPAVNPQATRNVLDAIFASSSMTASESDSTVRESFAGLLGQFPAKRSLQPLKAMALGGSGVKGPVAAVQALGKYTKNADAYDLLVSLLPRESFQSRLRQAALEALGRLGDPRAHPLGLDYARPWHAQNVRTGAFRLLAGIGRSEGGVLSESSRLSLETALVDTAYPIRLAAVGALGSLGNAAAIPALTRVMQSDPELKVRTAAKEAIEEIRG